MIERLDFELPTVANPSFTVPVTAQPQAIYLRTKCMTGTVAQNHEYDAWGFWATGTGGTAQCGAGYQHVDNTASANPHSKCNAVDILVLEDHLGGTLNVRVTAVSATQITLDVSGSLLANGIRVIGFSASGFEDAWCGAYQINAYPILFTSGFQPDFALFSQIGARPDDTVFVSTNSAVVNFGAMNETAQASISRYIDSTSVGDTSQAASALDLSWWMNRGSLLEQFYGQFTATGLQILSRAATNTTSTVQTQLALLLKGAESTIDTGTTTSGTIPHAFTHNPEVMILAGSGNNLWDTRETNAATAAWGQSSQAIASPGATVGASSIHSASDSANAGRLKHRNNTDGACWGLEGAVTPTAPINKYRGEITIFDSQAAETNWTLDGTGVPAGAFPFFLVAFNATGDRPIPLNTGNIDAYIGDTEMELLPDQITGGFAPFGPGVFR